MLVVMISVYFGFFSLCCTRTSPGMTTSPKYIRLHCASCDKVLGWRESRDDTRWILTLCDDCHDEKDEARQT